MYKHMYIYTHTCYRVIIEVKLRLNSARCGIISVDVTSSAQTVGTCPHSSNEQS